MLATFCVSSICALAFWDVDLNLSGGVLQRMGLLFFLGSHFLLTGLASIGLWKGEPSPTEPRALLPHAL